MAEFTGERVIPDQVDADLLNEHLARYTFAARFAQGKRVLDAGCGVGYGAAELAKTAVWVTGTDQSGDAIVYAREHYRLPNLSFEQASCTHLPHRDGSFDLVVCFEVIEHLENWWGFLTEVRRVLTPTGQFIVSTPNKLYYAETRERTGPNPFHVHEFEFAEFRSELAEIFPQVSMYLENHVEAVVFQPLETGGGAAVRVEGAEAPPEESHFFVAVCGHRAQAADSTFVYVPSAANVLRERERHIDLLESELRAKNEWLERAKEELAELNRVHQELLGMFRTQKEELEARNEWALKLNRELEASGARVGQLQAELAKEQADTKAVVESYEGKVAELEQENRAKTEWALETERRLNGEVTQKSLELAQCVEYLHQAEKTVEERTAWAGRLQAEANHLERQLALLRASRWVRLGRKMGLGPELPQR